MLWIRLLSQRATLRRSSPSLRSSRHTANRCDGTGRSFNCNRQTTSGLSVCSVLFAALCCDSTESECRFLSAWRRYLNNKPSFQPNTGVWNLDEPVDFLDFVGNA